VNLDGLWRFAIATSTGERPAAGPLDTPLEATAPANYNDLFTDSATRDHSGGVSSPTGQGRSSAPPNAGPRPRAPSPGAGLMARSPTSRPRPPNSAPSTAPTPTCPSCSWPTKFVDRAAADGIDLQLSGHTHGGQIWPFHHLVRIDQPALAGLSHHGTRTLLYTSRGTGFWGPPFRVFAPSEITLLVLRSPHLPTSP
jgi:hypothetical protein